MSLPALADMQPRAQHFMHQHDAWNGADYICWIGRQWEAFGVVRPATTDVHQAFDAWLAQQCGCQS